MTMIDYSTRDTQKIMGLYVDSTGFQLMLISRIGGNITVFS